VEKFKAFCEQKVNGDFNLMILPAATLSISSFASSMIQKQAKKFRFGWQKEGASPLISTI